MKLTGIVAVGTYHCPWFKYGLASFYFCDEIIVVNGGYDLKQPDLDEYNIPLEQVSRDISELDVEGKVFEWTDWTLDDLKGRLVLATQIKHEALNWADLRGINLTLASMKACERGADWILKWDSDQVGYRNCIGFAANLTSRTFKQYEFVSDIWHLADPPPDSPYNDSVYSFKADMSNFFGGGGAPAILGPRVPSYRYECAHLRSANPTELSLTGKFEHFFGRIFFRLFTNEYGTFNLKLHDRAVADAKAMLRAGGGPPSTIAPPEACMMGPEKYIEEVIL